MWLLVGRDLHMRYDTRILNHVLVNFSLFLVPPKGIHVALLVVNISIVV
jgi:hypothetical protein